MNKFQEFEQRINRALTRIGTKLEHLQSSFTDFKSSFDEFKDETGDFMKFMAEHVSDHEQRLSRIEKHLDME